jgi:hypothetical protein
MRRAVVTAAAVVALAAAGVGTAEIVLNTITLRGGQCVKVAKTRVCAVRNRARTVTVAGPASTTVTTTQTVAAPPPPPAVAFRDGTFRVGADIAPGTYRASSPTSCYWARLRGFSGDLGDIIANANYVGIVTIAGGDIGFLSQGCGNWVGIS